MTKTVLIVEDSNSFRTVVSLALQRAGYAVLEAENGVDALAKLDGSKIDLVVSDVNMPELDGIQFLQQLKQHQRYKYTPVIMLTTEGQDEKIQQGLAAGAKAWIVKPCLPPVLLDAVKKLLQP